MIMKKFGKPANVVAEVRLRAVGERAVAAFDRERRLDVGRVEARREDDHVDFALHAVLRDDRVLADLGMPSVTSSTFSRWIAG